MGMQRVHGKIRDERVNSRLFYYRDSPLESVREEIKNREILASHGGWNLCVDYEYELTRRVKLEVKPVKCFFALIIGFGGVEQA